MSDSSVRVVPEPDLDIYECFACGKLTWTNAPLGSCINCGERENFYQMD